MMRMVTVIEASRFMVANLFNALGAHLVMCPCIVRLDRRRLRLHSGPASTDSVQTTSCARNQQAKKIMVNDRLTASFSAESLLPMRRGNRLGGGDGKRDRPWQAASECH
jgi:hypothetical protein